MKPVCGQLKTKRLIRNEEGSTGVLFAMLAVPMFAMVGMAVDYARSLNSRESMQQSIDAAVLAASNTSSERALAAVTQYNSQAAAANEPTVDPTVDNGKKVVAQQFFKANLKKVIADAKAEFQVQADGTLIGKAWADVQTPVVALIKSSKTQVVATAEARPPREATEVSNDDDNSTVTSVTPCIHVMDQSGAKAFDMDSNSGLNASACGVRVRSSHGLNAMNEVSSSNVKFASVKVKGYASLSGKLQITADPFKVQEHVHDSDVTGDPYDAKMRQIQGDISTAGTCKNTTGVATISSTASPGTYCGEITFSGVTFQPGVYVIAGYKGKGAKDPSKDGRLKFSGKIDGSAGVTFVIGDNKGQFAGYTAGENSTLVAAKSGPTKGILFLDASNRGGKYGLTIKSVNKQSWTGLFYAPNLDLVLDSLSEWPVMNVGLSVNRLKLKSISSMLVPYAWTPDGASEPIVMDEVRTTAIKEGWLYK